MNTKINVGDEVCVNFNNVQYTLCSRAIVEYIPKAAGDSWVFRDTNTEKIHYVSEGCTITLLSASEQSKVNFDELLDATTALQQAATRAGSVIGNSLKTIYL